jgi:hypothetical protein
MLIAGDDSNVAKQASENVVVFDEIFVKLFRGHASTSDGLADFGGDEALRFVSLKPFCDAFKGCKSIVAG